MKRDPYEGESEYPLSFIILKNPSGAKSDQVGYFADFFPTVLELIGEPIENKFDGNSIAGVIHGKRKSFEREPLYWEFYEKRVGVQPVLEDGKPFKIICIREIRGRLKYMILRDPRSL